MKRHILIEKAYVYAEPTETPKPVGCTFNNRRGYWLDDATSQPLMNSDKQKPSTSKKCDRETGEDQKGA